MPWQKHMSYFGSPEAYAKEIQRKESTGQSFSDPSAAEAFKAAHPEYFQSSSPAKEAQKAANARSKPSMPKGISSYASGKSSITEGTGGSSKTAAEILAETGMVTLPDGRQVSAVELYLNPELWSDQAAYERFTEDAARLGYGIGTGTQQPTQLIRTGQQYQQPQLVFDPAKYVAANIEPVFREFMAIYDSVSSDASLAPLVAQAYQQVISTIEQAEAAIKKQFEEQIGGVDPATQAALATLKETFRRQRQTMLEDLSKRGLLESGIWIEAETRLRQGYLTEEQRMLGERLSDLQTRLNQALQNFANQRIQAAQVYTLEGLRTMEEEQKKREEAIASNLERAIQQARWEAEQKMMQEQRATERAAEQARWEAEQELKWYEAQAPYLLVPRAGQGIPTEQLANSYGYMLYQAQRDYSDAQKAGNEAKMAEAAARGQEIRKEAFQHGVTPEQLEKARLDWWNR